MVKIDTFTMCVKMGATSVRAACVTPTMGPWNTYVKRPALRPALLMSTQRPHAGRGGSELGHSFSPVMMRTRR